LGTLRPATARRGIARTSIYGFREGTRAIAHINAISKLAEDFRLWHGNRRLRTTNHSSPE
ncbi:MAG: hypothetical protein ACUVTW_15690, partial [Thermogutta sp.]